MLLRVLSFSFWVIATTHAVLAQDAGVGAWENPTHTTLDWLEEHPGLDWYYNWRSDEIWHGVQRRRSVEFVPMIHGADDVDAPIRSTHPPRALLGFNEPDGHGGSHQAGMSVAEAVALWPRLEARGLRLGSPATTQGQTLGPGSWQKRFMDEVDRAGLRVDFMAVHYYSTNGSVREFREWLVAVYREYERPIWVTEFARIDWNRPDQVSYADNADFASEAIRMMKTLPFVERYAWFAANPYSWRGAVPEINLVDDEMRQTSLGATFEAVLSGQAPEEFARAE
jgi:hypothetical protein